MARLGSLGWLIVGGVLVHAFRQAEAPSDTSRVDPGKSQGPIAASKSAERGESATPSLPSPQVDEKALLFEEYPIRHCDLAENSQRPNDVVGCRRCPLNHRVKNTLAMIQAIASQSLRRAAEPEEFVASFSGRVQALARAHDLIVQRRMQGAEMMELVCGQVSLGGPDTGRISCSGPPVVLDARSAVQLALVLHELATNARKHGSLAGTTGRLAISWHLQVGSTRELEIEWIESGVSELKAPVSRGFGSTLIERSMEANGGEVLLRYAAGGLSCRIRLPLPEEARRPGTRGRGQ